MFSTSANSFLSIAKEEAKKDVEELDLSEYNINSLRPVKYRYIDTNILNLCNKSQMIEAMNKYTLCKTNEMGIMNLLLTFKYNLWEPFPFKINDKKIKIFSKETIFLPLIFFSLVASTIVNKVNTIIAVEGTYKRSFGLAYWISISLLFIFATSGLFKKEKFLNSKIFEKPKYSIFKPK